MTRSQLAPNHTDTWYKLWICEGIDWNLKIQIMLWFKEADEVKYWCGHLLHSLEEKKKKFHLKLSPSFRQLQNQSKYQSQQNHCSVISRKKKVQKF